MPTETINTLEPETSVFVGPGLADICHTLGRLHQHICGSGWLHVLVCGPIRRFERLMENEDRKLQIHKL